jgi:hypothetical protein
MSSLKLLAQGTIALVVLATGACAMSTEPTDTPAKIVAPTAQSRAELRDAVMTALDGMPVTLADDALTRESTLSIERQPARDSGGQRIDARETTRPELFRLVKHSEACVLIHDRTQSRTTLKATRCE